MQPTGAEPAKACGLLPCENTGAQQGEQLPTISSAEAARLFERAKLLQQTRQFHAALDAFERLASLMPTDGRVWMRMMGMHKAARRYAQAEATLLRGIEHCPDNALLRQALADVYRDQRRWKDARHNFREAMRLNPSLRSVYDSWGRMEATLGNCEEAEALFKRGLTIEPTARTYHALGVLLDSRLGRTEEARRTLLTGLRLPNAQHHPPLLHALGLLEERAGNHAAARRHLNEVIEVDPSFTQVRAALHTRHLQGPRSLCSCYLARAPARVPSPLTTRAGASRAGQA